MKDNYLLFAIYISFFLSSIVFSFLINNLFLKFSKTLGIRSNTEDIIRWSSVEKPALGGISFYILFLLSIAAYSIFVDQSKLLLNAHYLGLIISVNLGFLMGLADDAYDTKPLLKFAVQLTCAFMLIISGTYIQIFDHEILNYLITVFWVVGLMNSVNMLDNMDAITACVSVSIISTTIIFILLNNDYTNLHLMPLLGVLAALLGFLYFNWHPSKMYMGDTGSQLLGVFLAAIGITYFWNGNNYHAEYPFSKALISPLIVFILPLIDTTIVVINRLGKGSSPFIGGKDHTTHCLAYFGLSDRQVALVFSAISLFSMLIIVAIEKWINWNWQVAAALGLYIICLFLMFFWFSRRKAKREL